MEKIFLVICTALLFVVTSCGGSDSPQNKGNEGNRTSQVKKNQDTDTTKNKKSKPPVLSEKDSLMIKDIKEPIINKIEFESTTSKIVTTSEDSVEELKTQLNGLKIYFFILVVLCCIILIFCIKSVFSKRGKKSEELEGKFEELQKKIKSLEDQSKQILSRINSTSMQSDIKRELHQIGDKLSQVLKVIDENEKSKRTRNDSNYQEVSKQPKESESQRVGYAKINTNEYFTEILDSNKEGCVFRIEFNGVDKGKFSIISLDKIKYINYWQEVIDCSGVSIADATDFVLEKPGVCEKTNDGKLWKVTEPLKIKLTK